MPEPEKKPVPIRVFNSISRLVNPNGEIGFDALLKKAKKNTNLSDLGTDFNETALKTLIDSANNEAYLSPFGRLMFREKLISQLENRLWVEHWVKKHPEILDQPVLPIILITGLQRTGTTKLQRLLSGLPEARELLSWEALYPAPVGDESETKKRIKRTVRNEKAVKWISPIFHTIHPIHVNEPEEDVLLLDLQFMSTTSEAILNVPSYASWLEQQDQREGYRYEEKLLKVLQWQRSAKFWVLKSPHHLQYLQEFSDVFPDSRIVWMHRNPVDCVPSFLSMLYYGRSMFADKVSVEEIKSFWLDKLQRMIQAGLKYRDKHHDRILDLQFENLINSEKETLSRILDFAGFSSDENDLSQILDGNGGYKSRHRYELSDWNLSVKEINDMFSSYNQQLLIIDNGR